MTEITTHAEALEALQIMLAACMKARSNSRESLGTDPLSEYINEDLHPWLFGERCIVPSLIEVVNRSEKGSDISGSNFYNFMWIAHKEPMINLSMQLWEGYIIPDLNMEWFGKVWTNES